MATTSFCAIFYKIKTLYLKNVQKHFSDLLIVYDSVRNIIQIHGTFMHSSLLPEGAITLEQWLIIVLPEKTGQT